MKILYKDNDIVICIKPSGVISTDEPGGMPELIRKELALTESVRTVHRLDTVVGGVMVYALTHEAASELSRQITEGIFQKEYLAVTEGHTPEHSGRFEDYLVRDPDARKTYASAEPRKGGKPAALTYSEAAQAGALSLVRIQLITGRTHQIRAQFSSRRLPLYGDKKYGAANAGDGIALWSCHLRFLHPGSGQEIDISAPPPDAAPWNGFGISCGEYEEAEIRSAAGRQVRVSGCRYASRCGGCVYQGKSNEEQLKEKQKFVRKQLAKFGTVLPIIGMEDPFHYRNKVFSAFGCDRQGGVISGMYAETSHRIVPVDSCLINSETADRIILSVRELLTEFRIQPFDERRGSGWLRHVMVRISESSGDAMVVLVAVSAVFKSKNAFLEKLISLHPEIKTVVLNVNAAFTPVVLGREEKILYGPGYIEDTLSGLRFRISSKSFYQVNHLQTEVLYGKIREFADLHGRERVIDAYCGTGTIGLILAAQAEKVLGIELNREAVGDAVSNARRNGIENIKFINADAGEYMQALARSKDRIDVAVMDPPRSGSTKEFLESVVKLNPPKVIYVSCSPETLARDLDYLTAAGYRAEKIQPVDMFPFTQHVETVVLLVRKTPDAYVRIKMDMEDFDLTKSETKVTTRKSRLM